MPIPLPNLDDRRWADLVEEGRSLIPVYAPDWTDHNVHDPGITLIELFAWLAEMDIYQLNRITDEHKRKFLSLVGITARPPLPSQTVVGFTLKDGAPSTLFEATAEVAGIDVFGTETRFRTLDGIDVAPGELKSVQIKDARGFYDYTDDFKREQPFGMFGTVPEPGAELYLGFTKPLDRNRPLSIYFKFAGSRSGARERARIREEAKAQARACRPPASEIGCEQKYVPRSTASEEWQVIPQFYGARLTWEFLAEAGGKQKWLPLDPEKGQVIDDTRAFTLDGRVAVRVSAEMAKETVGRIESPLYYIRCRFEAGAYDAPPQIQTIVMNGVRVEQATPVATKLAIRNDAVIEGNEPLPGNLTGMRFELDEQQKITRLSFEDGDDIPKLRVLAYNKNSLAFEAVFVGTGDGHPNQEFGLPIAPVVEESLKLLTIEEGSWRAWELKPDFDAARSSNYCFTLDATEGRVRFGDGRRGRVPPRGAALFASYRSTRADAGNLAARAINYLADSPHNRALLASFDSIKNRLQVINPIAAAGGSSAESLEEAEGRAIDLMNSTERAVTLKDYEELAMRTPGARLARAAARANIHPSFPCLKATGMIMLVILPDMPVARPTPSAALRRAVARYLDRRRVIGTRVEVVAPTYLELTVRTKVKALAGASKASLQQKIVEALAEFLDPLRGGPERTGWPFGRDVYRSEIMQVIDEVAGVDHVYSLELIADGCDPQCGNVCLGPTWLVASGRHEIEVI